MKRASAALATGFAAVLLLAGEGGTASRPLAGEGGTASRPLRVGLVLQSTDVGNSYEHGPYVGFLRAVRRLGVSGRVLAPDPKSGGLLPALLYLARQKYDLVLTYGFTAVGDLDAAAVRYPRTKFAIVDASVHDLPHHPANVRGGLFASQEPSYLAGYLAALMEKRRPGKDVIGSVGGIKIPTVDAFIAGYQAGARKADPGITTLNGYSNTFVDPSRCRPVALGEIARGAGVIFQVASGCGLGALQAAKERGAWGIGVDVDQSSLGPFVLTSVVKHLDVAMYQTVKDFKSGHFKTGRDTTFDLANGGVGLGKFSPRVPRSYLRKVERIGRQIVSGKISVPSTIGAP